MKKTALVALSALSFAAFGAVSASADTIGVSLNAVESIALYGTSIPGQWFNGASADTCTFTYVGNTFDVKSVFESPTGGNSEIYPPMANLPFPSGRGTMYWDSNAYDDQNTPQYFTNTLAQSTNYLIYEWETPVDSLPAPGNSFDFQLQLDFPIGVDCQAFGTSVFWTSSEGARRDVNSTRSTMTLFGAGGSTDDIIKQVIGIRPGNSDYANYYSRPRIGVYLGSVLNYEGETVNDRLFERYSPYCIGCAARAGDINDDTSTVSIRGQLLNIKKVTTGVYPQMVDVSTGVYSDYTNSKVYLLIQCPIIYGEYEIIPPDSGEVDWNGVADNVGNIVYTSDQIRQILLRMESVQQDIKTAETVHTSQLIDILSRLNAIYNELDFSVPELEYAQTLPVDENAMQTVESALSDYEFPDYLEENQGVTQAASGFSSLLNQLKNSIPGKVWNFIWFSIACGLIHWLLFHGRGA